jgi:predicted transcriptional regulator
MPTTQVAFRLDDDVVKRIDEYAKRLASKTPGIEYSRSDAARALLVRGLDAAEADAGAPPPATEPQARKRRA